jgi:hypothetical protein
MNGARESPRLNDRDNRGTARKHMELRSDAALDEGFQFAGIRALDFLPCDAETEHRAPRALIDVLLAPVALDAFRHSHRGNRLA